MLVQFAKYTFSDVLLKPLGHTFIYGNKNRDFIRKFCFFENIRFLLEIDFADRNTIANLTKQLRQI